jgi:predicted nucleic acid-binding protein
LSREKNEEKSRTEKKVFVDTSIIVDVDRGKKDAIELCRLLTRTNSALISTVTVSEILTGSYLRNDYKTALGKAEKVLGEFTWVSLDGEIARLVAELNAYLISNGLPIEYEDVAIAASCLSTGCEILLTENKDHFARIPKLKSKVKTPKELLHRF